MRPRRPPLPAARPTGAATASPPGGEEASSRPTSGRQLGEHHLPRWVLEHRRHLHLDVLAHLRTTALHDHHGPVVQVGHPLVFFLALTDDPHRQTLSRKHYRFQGVGEFVHVQHEHALDLSDLVQIVVGGEYPRAHLLGQFDELHVDFRHTGEVLIGDDDALVLRLQVAHTFESPSAAGPAQGFGGVGDRLQFLEHEAGYDQVTFKEVGGNDVPYAGVYDHRRVQDLRSVLSLGVGGTQVLEAHDPPDVRVARVRQEGEHVSGGGIYDGQEEYSHHRKILDGQTRERRDSQAEHEADARDEERRRTHPNGGPVHPRPQAHHLATQDTSEYETDGYTDDDTQAQKQKRIRTGKRRIRKTQVRRLVARYAPDHCQDRADQCDYCSHSTPLSLLRSIPPATRTWLVRRSLQACPRDWREPRPPTPSWRTSIRRPGSSSRGRTSASRRSTDPSERP